MITCTTYRRAWNSRRYEPAEPRLERQFASQTPMAEVMAAEREEYEAAMWVA